MELKMTKMIRCKETHIELNEDSGIKNETS